MERGLLPFLLHLYRLQKYLLQRTAQFLGASKSLKGECNLETATKTKCKVTSSQTYLLFLMFSFEFSEYQLYAGFGKKSKRVA